MRQTADLAALSRKLAEIASSAALEAGHYALDRRASRITYEVKAGFYDPVTECDREAERIIAERIFGEHADSAMVGEEGPQRGDGSVLWYVDPIDGTNNFVAGLPYFCVSIAASFQSTMLAGVVYDPSRRELFVATVDSTTLNGKPIRSSGHSSDDTSLLLTGFPYSGGRTKASALDQFGRLVSSFRAVRRLGAAALELAYVACGRAEVAFGLNASPWDVAAGMLLVERAGGRYIPLRAAGAETEQEPWLSRSYIATCPEFDLPQSSVIEVLSSIAPDRILP